MQYSLLTFFFVFQGFSQQTQIDKWLDSLKLSTLTPASKISLHEKLGEAYKNADPAKAAIHALQCIELAHDIGDVQIEASGYHLLGISHIYLGNFEEAMKNFFESLKLYESVNDLIGTAKNLKNIGGIYFSLKQYEKALEYASKSLELQREVNDSTGIADGLFAVGLLESRLGLDTLSMTHYEQALELYKLLGNTERQAGIFYNLSEIWFNNDHIERALEYSRLSISLRRENGSKRGLASSLNRYAELNLKARNYDLVQEILDECLEISTELGLQPQLRDNYLFQTRLDSINGNFESAFINYRKYTNLKDSITQSKNKDLLLELENKHLEEKQLTELKAKDAMIEKQWTLVLAVVVVLLAVLIITLILYRNNTQKQKINETLAEQKTHIQSQNSQLAELNKVKDKWFSIISHDFRSPLTFLQGAMNLLNTGDLNEDETRMLTVEVEDRVKRTSVLLDNLMYWAQSHLDGVQLGREKVDLHALIQELQVKFETELNAQSIQVENLIPSPAFFATDPDLISLIVHNLMEYILSYSKKGDRLVFEAYESDNELLIQVLASGMKIFKEEQESLFSMDSKLIKEGNAAERATGLGLVLCKDFLDKVGGSICIGGQADFPASFCFSIPLIDISADQEQL